MRWGRRTVFTRHESRAGGCRRAGWYAALAGFLLALVVGGVAPRQGSAGTIPSISTPSVSVPPVSVPTASVPTVTVPTVSVPTVTVPKVTVPTVTAPNPPTPTVPTVSVPKLPIHTPTVPAVSTPSTHLPSTGSHSPAAGAGSRYASQPAGGGAGSTAGGSSGARSTAGGATGSAGGTNESFAVRVARDGAGSAMARPPRGRLSQPYLRRVVSQLKGCLSSLPARQSEVLVLRTGTGLRHSYTRAQVAKILHVTVAQEGRLEHQAVTGLGKASVGSGCAAPARSLQRAVSLTMRAVTNFINGFSSPSAPPAGASVSGAPKASPKRSHARPKHSPAPQTATSPAAPARLRSAGIVSPDNGGLSWMLLALMIAAGTAALMLMFAYLRSQPETGPPEGQPNRWLALRHRAEAESGV